MINIFARPTYLGNRYFPHSEELVLQRISTRVRGEEIAEYLNANLNPKSISPGDVCIHVKPYSLNETRDGDWLDFLDGGRLFDMLKKRPGVNIIAASECSFDYLKKELPNKLALIPQHHINIDKEKRKPNKEIVAGYIGGPSPEATRIYTEVEKRLKEIGVGFITCYDFKTRQDSVDFYKSIDVLVIADFSKDYNPHKIPTKIINAASFGVPSIAFPLMGYQEIEGDYMRVNSMDGVVGETIKLKDLNYYVFRSIIALEMAKKYHISKIAEMYRQL
jgi:hypothetical protein